MYKNSEILACNRKASCSYFVSLTAYMNNGVVPRGREFVQVVQKLCELAGVDSSKLVTQKGLRALVYKMLVKSYFKIF